MTGQPPPDPRSSRDRDLGFDEFIAILVALAAIGSILFWGLTRNGTGFSFRDFNPFIDAAEPEPESGRFTLDDEPATEGVRPPVESANVERTPLDSTVDRDTEPTPVTRAIPPSPSPSVLPDRAAPSAPIVPIIVAPPPSAETVAFTDVPADYWALPFITSLSQRGIISGFEDGTFRPEEPVTRSQYSALIENILPGGSQQDTIDFDDVPSDYWASATIDSAVQAGFLRGYPDGTFQPEAPISKVQVLASLSNGIRLPEVAAPEQTLQLFEDRDQIPDWAIPIVASATDSGVVVNYPNRARLNPNQAVTRAEVAALIYQALEATGQVEPVQSEYVVNP